MKGKAIKATFNNPDGTTKTIDLEYDSQITLPTPEVPEGKVFNGWMVDGRVLETDLFTLEDEKDIAFVASVSDKSTALKAIHSAEKLAKEHMVASIVGFSGVLILIVLIGRGRAGAKRRRR